MDKQEAKTGNLPITLATFIYMLHDSQNFIDDGDILAVCEEIEENIRKASLRSLVTQIQGILQTHKLETTNERIQGFLNEIYGEDIFQSIDINELGMKLVVAIEKTLPASANINEVTNWLQERYSNIQNSWGEGDRDSLIFNIRKHGFQSSLPWLAQIAECGDAGLVKHWVMVEKFTDRVICMDPYPWDDIDEEYELPLTDFMVRWELAGSNGIHIG